MDAQALQQLQKEIQELAKKVHTLEERSVHNNMNQNTRLNINTAVVLPPRYLVADGSSLETRLSVLPIRHLNVVYNVPILLEDGNASLVGFISGSGAPTVRAPKGTLYMRTDGSSTTTRAYIATDSVGTWTHIVTGA